MKVIGLMSGTSGDAVDAALVEITGSGRRLKVRLLAFAATPYPPALQSRVLALASGGSVDEVCHMNALLGEWFARAARRVLRKARLSPAQIALIGSHGQTIRHRPAPIREAGIGTLRSTLQIAEPAIIAERTGITTIADFRPRDLAAGGEGAPLAPYVHYLLLRDRRRHRLILNLGGIGNVTYLPAAGALETVRAFDTGPGNMLLDGIVQLRSGGRQRMDRDGKAAARGRVDPTLLAQLLAHPFLKRRPPKSTGREDFGRPFLERLLAGRRTPTEDLLATASFFTALTVSSARRWLQGPVDEVIVAGGGASNPTLMSDLAAVFDPVPLRKLDDLGWSSRAFEAVAFAVLAYQTWQGEPANVPAVTGARRPVVLGAVVPGRQGWPPATRRRGG